MTISAVMVRDSIAPHGVRLTTMQLKYPRFIHAEFMTHRVFSRNASSSRAIPVERMIQSIIDDTAMPVHWGKNQPGMQAREECDELIYGFNFNSFDNRDDGVDKVAAWNIARDKAISVARAFHNAGYHKQVVNRLLEPFMHINVLVTATEWDNFFSLRIHPDAQPEIHVLAKRMKDQMDASTPTPLALNQWHLPYVSQEELESHPITTCIRLSVARCARVSYLTHDGATPEVEKDVALYERLVGSVPLHASPAEHQGTPAIEPGLSFANFKGWIQYRGLIENTLSV